METIPVSESMRSQSNGTSYRYDWKDTRRPVEYCQRFLPVLCIPKSQAHDEEGYTLHSSFSLWSIGMFSSSDSTREADSTGDVSRQMRLGRCTSWRVATQMGEVVERATESDRNQHLQKLHTWWLWCCQTLWNPSFRWCQHYRLRAVLVPSTQKWWRPSTLLFSHREITRSTAETHNSTPTRAHSGCGFRQDVKYPKGRADLWRIPRTFLDRFQNCIGLHLQWGKKV